MTLALTLMLMLLASAGCRTKGGEPADAAAEVAVWRPRPVSIRVYPSTRLVVQDGEAILEARVELSDEMGDPIKAPGEFRLELYSDETKQQLYAWRVRVLTLDEQRTF